MSGASPYAAVTGVEERLRALAAEIEMRGLVATPTGMTMRDYFAAHASEQEIQWMQTEAWRTSPTRDEKDYHLPRELARYLWADRMLRARTMDTSAFQAGAPPELDLPTTNTTGTFQAGLSKL